MRIPDLAEINPILRVRTLLWDTPLPQDNRPVRAAIFTGRIAWVIVHDLIAGRANQQAMSLVYTTLLALVPVLAIVFAVLKAFGVQNHVADLMREFLAPLGAQGAEITDRTLAFVEQVNISVLGSVGLVFLIYTLVSTMQKIEKAFNEIWHVRSGRSLARQLTEFVSVGLLGPLALFLAFGIMATAVSSEIVEDAATVLPIKETLQYIGLIMPYLVMVGMFSLLYKVIPHTHVQPSAAMLGGLTAGLIWVATGWAFATFVVTSARYAAIYSAFASLVFFMIWLYAAWLILLTGCSVSYYYQNRRHLSPELGVARLTMRDTDRITLAVLVITHRAFKKGGRLWPAAVLARRLNVPLGVLEDIIYPLREAGFLAVSEQGGRIMPGRDAAQSDIDEAIETVRRGVQAGALSSMDIHSDEAVDALFARLDEARRGVLKRTATVADLLAEAENLKQEAAE